MIEVKHEKESDHGGFGPPYEHCYFCDKATPYWETNKDVACCQECAATHEPKEIVSKEEWLKIEDKRHPMRAIGRAGFA
jgi:hypothetical protein